MAKIHRSAGQRTSLFTSSRRKNKSVWDRLELLIIPGVLLAGAFFVHDQVAQKQSEPVTSSSAEQAVLSVQPSNQPDQSSLNQNLPEAEQAYGEQVLTQTSPDNESSWLDGTMSVQLRKSLRRADLSRSDGRIENFKEIQPVSETNLLTDKVGKTDSTSSDLEDALLQKFFSKTDQDLPRSLVIDNNTKVNLSRVDLFSNHLTSADLFEIKRIKADFRGASFSKASLIDIGFSSVSLFGADPVATALLNMDVNKVDFWNEDLISSRRSLTQPIKLESLSSKFSKIDLVEAGFGATSFEALTSTPKKLPTTYQNSADLNQ